MGRLVAAVCEAFSGDTDPETTLEVNPSTVERERLPGFREAGVNRLSVGVQSFDDAVLKRLGRAHRAEAAHETLAASRAAGFDNVSVDLIVGVPGQAPFDVERDLAELVAFGPEHVSAYALTLEPGTPFAVAAAAGKIATASEDDALAMFDRLAPTLEPAGYRRYEISSHARPGREAIHNRRYWQRRPVLGLGVGAVSSEPPTAAAPFGARSANPRTLAAWATVLRAAAPREREVLQLIAEGNSYKEIAAALGISPKTVGQHRDRLMQKLHCRRTAELVKFALREGLTPAGD